VNNDTLTESLTLCHEILQLSKYNIIFISECLLFKFVSHYNH